MYSNRENTLYISLAGLFSLLTVACALYYTNYLFDFTDESFYHIWISRPFDYPSSVSQFGFFYNIFFKAIGGSIVLLRQISVISTCVLFSTLVYCLLTKAIGLEKRTAFLISLSVASSAMMTLLLSGAALHTPSYNSLGAQGILLTMIGVFLRNRASRHNAASVLCLAFGLWLAFLGRPPTAFVLSVLLVLYAILTRDCDPWYVARIIVFSLLLLLLTAFYIDGGIGAFIERYKTGLELVNSLGGGHQIQNFFRTDLSGFRRSVWNTLAISFFLPLLLLPLRSLAKNRQNLLFLGLIFLALLYLFLFRLEILPSFLPKMKNGLLYYTFPVFFAGYFIFFHGKAVFYAVKKQYAGMVLFIFLPFAYVIGTNNHYVYQSTTVAYLSLPLVFLLLPRELYMSEQKTIFRLLLCSSLLVLYLLTWGFLHPYHALSPLNTQNEAIVIGEAQSRLYLPPATHDRLTLLLDEAKTAGFTQGTPILDMTGSFPGGIFVLGGKALGQPWLLGGYPGSYEFALRSLKKSDPAELKAAWIFYSPQYWRSLYDEVLAALGLDLVNYEAVCTFPSPIPAHNDTPIVLYRPRVKP